MANKVEFGISNLHVGTYTDNNGTVTLGTPYAQKGAVSFSPEEQSEATNFYADNIVAEHSKAIWKLRNSMMLSRNSFLDIRN